MDILSITQVANNVASAGSRDSPLTNHGVLQAQRLGAHLAARSATVGSIKHIFASNLKRAVKTAQTIAEAQTRVDGVDEALEIVQVPELREKDFGSDEGKRFGSRGRHDAAGASSAADWIEPESHDSMRTRIERFVDAFLAPNVLETASGSGTALVVVVAHGIILNVLLRTLLARYGPDEISKLAKPRDDAPWRSEWLASWSNTGYLEADLRVVTTTVSDPIPTKVADVDSSTCLSPGGTSMVREQDSTSCSSENQDAGQSCAPQSLEQPPAPISGDIHMTVTTVNCVEHLQGLKKIRGGLGSLGHDEKQQTMDSFFSRSAKKPKHEEGGG